MVCIQELLLLLRGLPMLLLLLLLLLLQLEPVQGCGRSLDRMRAAFPRFRAAGTGDPAMARMQAQANRERVKKKKKWERELEQRKEGRVLGFLSLESLSRLSLSPGAMKVSIYLERGQRVLSSPMVHTYYGLPS